MPRRRLNLKVCLGRGREKIRKNGYYEVFAIESVANLIIEGADHKLHCNKFDDILPYN